MRLIVSKRWAQNGVARRGKERGQLHIQQAAGSMQQCRQCTPGGESETGTVSGF